MSPIIYMCTFTILIANAQVATSNASVFERFKRQTAINTLAQACPSTTSFCRNCVCDSGIQQQTTRCISENCCRALSISAPVCPNNANALRGTNPQITIGCCPFSQCQAGYYCAWDRVNGQWTCCSTNQQPIPTTFAPITQTPFIPICANGQRSIGPCLNGLCQLGQVCENGGCCFPTVTQPPITIPPIRDQFGCPSGTAVIYQYTLPRQLPLICNKPTAEGQQGFCPNGSVCLASINPQYSFICCQGANSQVG